jgi:hypothetical protein
MGRRAIKIVISVTQPSSMERSWIVNRGAAILSVIEAVAKTGRPVEIYGVRPSESKGTMGGGGADETLVLFPLSGESLARLAFVLAHPSFLRRIIFDINERSPENIRKIFGYYNNGGYSYSMALTKMALPENLKWLTEDAIIFEEFANKFQTPEDSVVMINKKLEESGVLN